MATWTVVVNPVPTPFEIVITWPAADPQAPPNVARTRMMDRGQAQFVADAVSAKLTQTLGA